MCYGAENRKHASSQRRLSQGALALGVVSFARKRNVSIGPLALLLGGTIWRERTTTIPNPLDARRYAARGRPSRAACEHTANAAHAPHVGLCQERRRRLR